MVDQTQSIKSKVVISSVFIKPTLKSYDASNDKDRLARLESQRNDKEALARNKRLFGNLLVGTLEKFKSEEENDRVRPKRVRQDPVSSDRDNELRLDGDRSSSHDSRISRSYSMEGFLPEKDDLEQRYYIWERVHCHLGNFIRTETKPKIFWLPKEYTFSTELLLKKTREIYVQCIAEQEEKHMKNLNRPRLASSPIHQSQARSSPEIAIAASAIHSDQDLV